MQIKIPYLNTRIETDLLVTFLLIPIWWVTGFSAFVYHLVPLIVLLKLAMRKNQPLQIPHVAFWFFTFSISYLISIMINIGLRPVARVVASFNNFSLIVLGLLLMIGVYNSDASVFFRKLLQTCRILCIVTSVIGVCFLVLWKMNLGNVEIPTLLATRLPSLLEYPYFYNFLRMGHILPGFADTDLPRLTIYSMVPTATGGLMLALMPMMMAYYKLHPQKRLEYSLVFLASLTVLFFSLSRAAIYGFVFSWIFLYVFKRGFKTRVAVFCALTALISSGYLMKGFEWILNTRTSSNIGRFELYEQAIRILLDENLLMGVGVRFRDDFTMMAIGSHSLYIEVVFVAGLIGLLIFLAFQFLVLKHWFDQKKKQKDFTAEVLWEHLGMSLIALNIWVITDTLLGLPFTAYAYYLIVGGILLLGKSSSLEGVA